MSRTEKTAGKVKLTAREKKAVDKAIRQAKGDGKPHTAQDSIPFEVIYPDGICKLPGKSYSKSLAFDDINYQLAQADDKTATFENLCAPSRSATRGTALTVSERNMPSC